MSRLNKIFNKKSLLRSIGLIIFVLIVVFKVDLGEFWQTVKSVEVRYLIGFVLIFLLATPLHPIRWQYILKKQGMRIKSRDSYSMVFSSILIGLVTPGRIGEIGARVAYFIKHKDGLSKSLAGIILEKIADIGFLFIFASVAILSFVKLLPEQFRFVAWGMLVVCGIMALLLAKNKFVMIMKKFVTVVVPARFSKIYEHLGDLYKNFQLIGKHGYSVVIIYTVIIWLTSFVSLYMILKSFGIDVGFGYFALATAIASLISLVPISISGIGTKDVAYLILFSPLGIQTEQIVSFSLSATLCVLLMTAVVGVVCWLFQPKDVAASEG